MNQIKIFFNGQKKNNGNILLTKDPIRAASSTDCVMTDKWISMGDKINKSKKEKKLLDHIR